MLVCTATLAWGVNLPCHLVVVKGTEFFDGKLGRYVDSPVTDVLQVRRALFISHPLLSLTLPPRAPSPSPICCR